MAPGMFFNFLAVKNHKCANNSTAAEAREKLAQTLNAQN